MKKYIVSNLLMFCLCSVSFGQIVTRDDQNILHNSHEKGCCDFPIPMVQAELTPDDLIAKRFQIVAFKDSDGTQKYKLKLFPSPGFSPDAFKRVIQAYTNYLRTIFPCVNGVGLAFALYDVEGVSGIPNNKHIAPTVYPIFRPTQQNTTINFTCPSCTPIMGGTNFFNAYYSSPTFDFPNDSSGQPLSPDNELLFNRKYCIGVGIWVDGCPGNPALACAQASSFRSFIVSSPAPSLKAGKNPEIFIEEFDEKGKSLKKYKYEAKR